MQSKSGFFAAIFVLVLLATAYLLFFGPLSTPTSNPKIAGPIKSPVDQGEDEPEVQEIDNPVIERVSVPRFGDLSEIRKRRRLRVLVQYSNTNFFFDGPDFHGFDYEIMTGYEQFLNASVSKHSERIVFNFVVKPFSELLTDLNNGYGDIAVANLTITPEREGIVQFTQPYLSSVNEVVVHNNSIEDIATLDDLSGQDMFLLSGSSFTQHMDTFNQELESRGLAPVNVIEADPDLSAEDIMELINAKVFPMTVADDFTARAWEAVLPNITIRDDLQINSGSQIAWAVRKDSPELLNSLNDYIESIRKGTLLGNIYFNRYFENSKWIGNPGEPEQIAKLEKYESFFKKYAEEYGFDWLSIVALAFQESRIDQSVVSPSGALGIMQIKPETAAYEPVGVDDISTAENNIIAGVRYLAYLRDKYFSSPDISPEDQVDFTWAAYNAGPGRISKLRAMAEENGYNPNKWFSNVERMAAREIGRETVEYVANVNKYYIAYKLSDINALN